MFKQIGLHTVAAAAFILFSGAASAAVSVYATPAAFAAATTTAGTESFNAEVPFAGAVASFAGAAGPYTFAANAPTTGLYFVGSVADVWLSTDSPGDTVTFGSFTGGASAVGGYFFATDFDGNVLANLSVTVAATYASGTTTQSISNSSASSFIGFVGDSPLLSLTVLAAQPIGGVSWTTANNLTLGVAAAVPEPESWALMVAGLGLVAGLARRRR